MLWLNALALLPGRRTATVVAGTESRSVVEQPGAELHVVEIPQRYVYEPQSAILAAQLSASLALEHHLSALTPEGGYLTGVEPIRDPALACFEVLDTLPFDIKQLKAYFRARNVGRLEIKKRGLDTTPERVRGQLNLRGEEAATLMLARVGERSLALVVRRTS